MAIKESKFAERELLFLILRISDKPMPIYHIEEHLAWQTFCPFVLCMLYVYVCGGRGGRFDILLKGGYLCNVATHCGSKKVEKCVIHCMDSPW